VLKDLAVLALAIALMIATAVVLVKLAPSWLHTPPMPTTTTTT
jgi:hypothetical protein